MWNKTGWKTDCRCVVFLLQWFFFLLFLSFSRLPIEGSLCQFPVLSLKWRAREWTKRKNVIVGRPVENQFSHKQGRIVFLLQSTCARCSLSCVVSWMSKNPVGNNSRAHCKLISSKVKIH
jgi:hypothetical protein